MIDDRLVAWEEPVGQKVLFESDRTSSPSLWSIDVETRRLVKLKDGFSGYALGLTRDGSMYYGSSSSSRDVVLADLDPSTGRVVGEPRVASSTHVGSTIMCDWSPDGKELAYRAARGIPSMNGPADWVVVSLDVETGKERFYDPGFMPSSRMWGPKWAPDGTSFLVYGQSPKTGRGLYTIDVKTGVVNLIVTVTGRLRPVWSFDGKKIYYQREFKSIVEHDVATGGETIIYNGDVGFHMDTSPDGRWLAFRTGGAIYLLPLAGGEPTWLATVPKNNSPWTINWTPDSERLLVVKDGELWSVHAETGDFEKISNAPLQGLVQAAVRPGEESPMIAYSAGTAVTHLWVMENFLAKP